MDTKDTSEKVAKRASLCNKKCKVAPEVPLLMSNWDSAQYYTRNSIQRNIRDGGQRNSQGHAIQMGKHRFRAMIHGHRVLVRVFLFSLCVFFELSFSELSWRAGGGSWSQKEHDMSEVV